jgi:hypothetical protein
VVERTNPDLKGKRDTLRASLPALSRTRADTYRLNSDALAIGRAGVTYQAPQEMARLAADGVTADDAMRSVQCEIRQLDDAIARASDKSFTWRVGCTR